MAGVLDALSPTERQCAEAWASDVDNGITCLTELLVLATDAGWPGEKRVRVFRATVALLQSWKAGGVK